MRRTWGLPFNQMTAEKRAEISRKGVEARNLKSMTWDWAAEMPRLRANVRAAAQAEVDAMAAAQ